MFDGEQLYAVEHSLHGGSRGTVKTARLPGAGLRSGSDIAADSCATICWGGTLSHPEVWATTAKSRRYLEAKVPSLEKVTVLPHIDRVGAKWGGID
jgi:hypothetical protein